MSSIIELIQLVLDPSQYNQGLKDADQKFKDTSDKINEEMRKTSESINQQEQDYKNLECVLSSVFKSAIDYQTKWQMLIEEGKKAEREEREEQKKKDKEEKDRIEKQRKEQEAAEKREHEANRKKLEDQKKMIAGFGSMAVAVVNLAAAGATLQKALDLTQNNTSLETWIKGMGASATKVIQIRNVLAKSNVSDQSTYGVLQKISEDQNILSTNGLLDENTRRSNAMLSMYDPTIAQGYQNGKLLSAEDMFLKRANAAREFAQKNPYHLDQNQLVKNLRYSFGGNEQITQLVLEGKLSQSELQKELKNAQAKERSFDKSRDVTREKAENRLITERNMDNNISNHGDVAVRFFEAINSFLDRYGEMAQIAKFLGEIGLSIGGFVFALKQMGLIKTGGTLATAGNALKGVAGGVLSKGGRLLGSSSLGPIALAYEITGGTPSTSENDVPIADIERRRKQDQEWKQRKYDIEQATGGKVDRSFWNNDLYVQTPDGTYVYLDNKLFEPIEKIKKELDNKRTSQSNTSTNSGITGSIFPSANAHELSNDNIRKKPIPNRAVASMIATSYAKAGYSQQAIEAQIASMTGESDLNPRRIGDKGISFGLGQWNKTRLDDFKRVMGIDIRNSTAQQQIDFSLWELSNTKKSVGNKLRQAKTNTEALKLLINEYEITAKPQQDFIKRSAYLPQRNITQGDTVNHSNSRNSITNNNNHSNVNVNIKVDNDAKAADNIYRKMQELKGKTLPNPGFYNMQRGAS